MSVVFLGQFLLERGEIDTEGLSRALELMEQENPNLGELAAEMGFASEAECRRVFGEQRRRDRLFGELALQMGVLNSVELDEVLERQQQRCIGLGEALVRLSLQPEDRVRQLLDEYKSLRGSYTGCTELPKGLRGHRVAEMLVPMLQRFGRRIARVELEVGRGERLDALPQSVLVAGVRIAGSQALQVTLAADPPFAERLAVGLSGLDVSDLAEELSLEAVGEFLNIVAGNTVAALDDAAVELRLSPPSYGVLPTSGFRFPVVGHIANAVLILLPEDPRV